MLANESMRIVTHAERAETKGVKVEWLHPMLCNTANKNVSNTGVANEEALPVCVHFIAQTTFLLKSEVATVCDSQMCGRLQSCTTAEAKISSLILGTLVVYRMNGCYPVRLQYPLILLVQKQMLCF